MKNNIHFLFYITKFSLNGKYFRQNCKENQNTHFILSNLFPKSCRLWDNVENYCIASQATDEKVAHAHCKLDTYVDKHILRICNTSCSSTGVMLAWKRLLLCTYIAGFVKIELS